MAEDEVVSGGEARRAGQGVTGGGLKASVALCTFNGADFIGPQLSSILGQSRPPDEVVLCDDGSTDATFRIARDVSIKSETVVRIVRNPQRLGFVKNFEQAVAQTTGDVVFLSDQDDFWLPRRMETMLAPFRENLRVGLVYCDAQLTDGSLRPVRGTVFGCRKDIGIENARSAHELVRGADIGISGCMMAFRSSLKEFVLPISGAWGHDHWIVFIAHALMDVRPVPEALMYYRRHERNSGFDPNLDGARWKGWVIGAKTTELGRYSAETARWESMIERLRQVRGKALPLHETAKLDEFLREAEQRLEFARTREGLKRKARHRRVSTGLRLLLRGDYHFYVHGLRSFCKDLLAR
jgi:glycosyltransferase involved in cell wall biosynthesis